MAAQRMVVWSPVVQRRGENASRIARVLGALFLVLPLGLVAAGTVGAEQPSPVHFHFEGHTYTAACALVPVVGRCHVVQSGHNAFHALDDLAGGVSARLVEGEISWDADSPVTETFSVFLVGRGASGPQVFDSASGTSPLSFHFDVSEHAGSAWEIHIHALSRQDAPFVVLTQELRQAFTLSGSATPAA